MNTLAEVKSKQLKAQECDCLLPEFKKEEAERNQRYIKKKLAGVELSPHNKHYVNHVNQNKLLV